MFFRLLLVWLLVSLLDLLEWFCVLGIGFEFNVVGMCFTLWMYVNSVGIVYFVLDFMDA